MATSAATAAIVGRARGRSHEGSTAAATAMRPPPAPAPRLAPDSGRPGSATSRRSTAARPIEVIWMTAIATATPGPRAVHADQQADRVSTAWAAVSARRMVGRPIAITTWPKKKPRRRTALHREDAGSALLGSHWSPSRRGSARGRWRQADEGGKRHEGEQALRRDQPRGHPSRSSWMREKTGITTRSCCRRSKSVMMATRRWATRIEPDRRGAGTRPSSEPVDLAADEMRSRLVASTLPLKATRSAKWRSENAKRGRQSLAAQRIDDTNHRAEQKLAHQAPHAPAERRHRHAQRRPGERRYDLARRQLAEAQIAPHIGLWTSVSEVITGSSASTRSSGASRGSP